MSEHDDSRAKYIMIGGFLGAGKTTAVSRLARYLIDRGLRVGLISNDQSTGLVDTALLRSHGFSVEEITGGCFCCRFSSLLEAANRLTSATRPDVFVAEPVGSCTDLIATVRYPLRRIYGDRFTTAPLSVLVDPARAGRILGISEGKSFSDKVVYIYRKQLEEADIIVVNKCDVVSESLRGALGETLRRSFPRAEIFCGSAKEGTGLSAWFERILSTSCDDGPAMELDYDRYGEGEALLGWLNGTVRLTAKEPFDPNELLLALATDIRKRLDGQTCEMAHLKMTLEAEDQPGRLAVVSLVGHEETPDLRESLWDRVPGGQMMINLRAEADPEVLYRATMEALEKCARSTRRIGVAVEHMERFRPAKPTPQHRAVEVG